MFISRYRHVNIKSVITKAYFWNEFYVNKSHLIPSKSII